VKARSPITSRTEATTAGSALARLPDSVLS
jgi:hypothetical protein